MKLFGNKVEREKRKKAKETQEKISNYPCETYLHNALNFLAHKKYNEAYSEICWCMRKAGIELTDNEQAVWRLVSIDEISEWTGVPKEAISAIGLCKPAIITTSCESPEGKGGEGEPIHYVCS